MTKDGLILSFSKLFFTTEGRMSKSRYWAISIPFWIFFWLLYVAIEQLLGSMHNWIIILLFLYAGICLSIKRLHDRDKSGFWLLLLLIPVIGPILVFFDLGFRAGTTGENRYGENPLESNYDYLTVK